MISITGIVLAEKHGSGNKMPDPRKDSIIVYKPGQSRDSIPLVTKSPRQATHIGISPRVVTLAMPSHDIYPKAEVIVPSDYVNGTDEKSDIAVAIVDANNSPINGVTSAIAKLYSDKGYIVTSSLFRLGLFQSPYLRELQNANSQLIEKLGLPARARYIILGTYSRTIEPVTSEYVKVVCRAKLDVRVISCVSRSQVNGFEISTSNGHLDAWHAEKGAIEKLMADYSTNYLNL